MVAALKAAIGRSHLITPELCVAYLRAWQTDCARWRKHIGRYPRGIGVDGALAALQIGHLVQPGVDGRISAGAKRRSASPFLARA